MVNNYKIVNFIKKRGIVILRELRKNFSKFLTAWVNCNEMKLFISMFIITYMRVLIGKS